MPKTKTGSAKEKLKSPFEHIFLGHKLTREQFTEAVDAWSERKCFIRSPLSEFISINEPENKECFAVVLKSLFETRYIRRNEEPYFGGQVLKGEIPPKWSFTVSPPDSYQRERHVTRIFADERVIICYECSGSGKVKHEKCNGTGRLPCPGRNCVNGMVSVTDTEHVTIEGPGETSSSFTVKNERLIVCSVCGGPGTVVDVECQGTGLVDCPTCHATGKLLSFPELVTNFDVNTDYRIFNNTQLPDNKIYRPKGWFRKEKLSGIKLVDMTGIDLGEIPNVNKPVNSAAEHLIRASEGDDEHRLRRRTLNISFVTVAEAGYWYRTRQGVICVHDSDRKVHKKGWLPLHIRNLVLTVSAGLAAAGAIGYIVNAFWLHIW